MAIRRLTWRHVATQGTLSSSTWRPHDRDLTATVKPDFILFMETHGASDFHRTAGRILGRTPRSRSDRTAIAARSSRDRGSFIKEPKPRSRRTIPAEDGKRKVHDRGPIALWSWTDRRLIVATIKRDHGFFWSKIEADSSQIWNHNAAQWKPSPRRINSTPTTESIAHDLWVNFLFKKLCILPLKLNFWSIREVN